MKSWADFDIFDVKQMTADGSTMPMIAHYSLTSIGLTDKLGISTQDLSKVLRMWDSGYQNNPYHNKDHAGDVTQGVYCWTTCSGLHDNMRPTLSLGMILASAIHDVGHPGVNNPFLVARGDPLALRYT